MEVSLTPRLSNGPARTEVRVVPSTSTSPPTTLARSRRERAEEWEWVEELGKVSVCDMGFALSVFMCIRVSGAMRHDELIYAGMFLASQEGYACPP